MCCFLMPLVGGRYRALGALRMPNQPRHPQADSGKVARGGEQRLGVVEVETGIDIQLHARVDSIGDAEIEAEVVVGVARVGGGADSVGVEGVVAFDEQAQIVGWLEVDAQRGEDVGGGGPVGPVRPHVIANREPLCHFVLAEQVDGSGDGHVFCHVRRKRESEVEHERCARHPEQVKFACMVVAEQQLGADAQRSGGISGAGECLRGLAVPAPERRDPRVLKPQLGPLVEPEAEERGRGCEQMQALHVCQLEAAFPLYPAFAEHLRAGAGPRAVGTQPYLVSGGMMMFAMPVYGPDSVRSKAVRAQKSMQQQAEEYDALARKHNSRLLICHRLA